MNKHEQSGWLFKIIESEIEIIWIKMSNSNPDILNFLDDVF